MEDTKYIPAGQTTESCFLLCYGAWKQHRVLKALSAEILHNLANLGSQISDLPGIGHLGLCKDKFGSYLTVPVENALRVDCENRPLYPRRLNYLGSHVCGCTGIYSTDTSCS